ncbi:AlpA family transcriptional regulator [Ideonella sp. A 288]|uniref:helix-turn-helix transcriptional regulator n=1 Tax=Ideonella sp. A 288 TaxID=1962181 RepID=UPI000B4AA81F|nr:AlpA family transcriptional regulator [Ideonella sp. A 288]
MDRSLTAPLGPQAAESPTVFLRLPNVIKLTGLGRSTIYRMVAANTFPRPVRLASRAIAWRRADLDRWSDSRQTVAH